MPDLISRRLAMSRSAAISRNHNPRNLELPWYAFWNLALDRLANKLHPEHCYVSPQFPLWRLWIEEEDGDEPELHFVNTEDDAIEEDIAIENDVDPDLDISFASESVAATWRGSKYSNRITDFALVFRVPREEPTSHDSDSDSDNERPMRVPDLATIASMKCWENVPVLVEIKRFVSRSEPTGASFTESLRDKLEVAKADVLKQAGLLLPLESS
jgi:hypothetical protein